MDWLRRRFGGDPRPGACEPEAALEALRTVMATAELDAAAAARSLRDVGRTHRACCVVTGPLHVPFRAAYEALYGPIGTATDDVAVVPWTALGAPPSLRAMRIAVDERRGSVVLVTPDDARAAAGAAAQLDALALVTDDADVALVLAGDLDLVLRRRFVDDANLNTHALDASDVIGALGDAAVAASMQVRSVAD